MRLGHSGASCWAKCFRCHRPALALCLDNCTEFTLLHVSGHSAACEDEQQTLLCQAQRKTIEDSIEATILKVGRMHRLGCARSQQASQCPSLSGVGAFGGARQKATRENPKEESKPDQMLCLRPRYDHHYYAWNHWAWPGVLGETTVRGVPDARTSRARAEVKSFRRRVSGSRLGPKPRQPRVEASKENRGFISRVHFRRPCWKRSSQSWSAPNFSTFRRLGVAVDRIAGIPDTVPLRSFPSSAVTLCSSNGLTTTGLQVLQGIAEKP